MYDICDIHSHILPGMDDGCKTVEESIAVLQRMYSDGVRKVFATPHYYARESVEAFLCRRQKSFDALQCCMEGELPEICCGAEVAWFPNLGADDGIKELCLGNSGYLLLELPFTPWSGQVIRDVNNLSLRGITPILAHFERYWRYQSEDSIQQLLQCDVLVQMNADTILDLWQRFAAVKALKKGKVHLLGSDCHGLTRRPSHLVQAVDALQKKKLFKILEQMESLGCEIFQKAQS